jgi:hypothetical protein
MQMLRLTRRMPIAGANTAKKERRRQDDILSFTREKRQNDVLLYTGGSNIFHRHVVIH